MTTVNDISRAAYAEYIVTALGELQQMQFYKTPSIIRSCLTFAILNVTFALSWANRMKDAALRSSCMRLLNWLRAGLRRAS